MHVFKEHRCKFIFVWMDCTGDSPGERGCVLLPARKDPARGKIRAHERPGPLPCGPVGAGPWTAPALADPAPSALCGGPWTAPMSLKSRKCLCSALGARVEDTCPREAWPSRQPPEGWTPWANLGPPHLACGGQGAGRPEGNSVSPFKVGALGTPGSLPELSQGQPPVLPRAWGLGVQGKFRCQAAAEGPRSWALLGAELEDVRSFSISFLSWTGL